MPADVELLLQRAQWAGQHALALFFVLLALLLAASCLGWWTVQRYTAPLRQQNTSPTLLMGLRIAAGGAVILVGVAQYACRD